MMGSSRARVLAGVPSHASICSSSPDGPIPIPPWRDGGSVSLESTAPPLAPARDAGGTSFNDRSFLSSAAAESTSLDSDLASSFDRGIPDIDASAPSSVSRTASPKSRETSEAHRASPCKNKFVFSGSKPATTCAAAVTVEPNAEALQTRQYTLAPRTSSSSPRQMLTQSIIFFR